MSALARSKLASAEHQHPKAAALPTNTGIAACNSPHACRRRGLSIPLPFLGLVLVKFQALQGCLHRSRVTMRMGAGLWTGPYHHWPSKRMPVSLRVLQYLGRVGVRVEALRAAPYGVCWCLLQLTRHLYPPKHWQICRMELSSQNISRQQGSAIWLGCKHTTKVPPAPAQEGPAPGCPEHLLHRST